MTTRFAVHARRTALLAALLLPVAAAGATAQAVETSGEAAGEGFAGTYLAARTADVEKDVPNAAEFYRSALKADPENLILLERALVLTAASGDVQSAIGLAEALLAKAPKNHAARLVAAVDRLAAGDYPEAIASLSGTGAGVLADLTTSLLTAWARYGAGDAGRALAELNALEGEDWYEPFKLLHSGYVALADGDTEEALERLGEARELDANAVRISEAYAYALVTAGRQAEAEEALADFLSRFPDNPLALAALERVRAGNSAAVSTPKQGAAEALAGIGAAVGQEGGVEVAFLYLRLALHLDERIAGGLAALSLGNLLDGNGQGEAAIEAFESIAPDAPFRALGLLRAALTLDRLERTEEAEAFFREAVARNPQDMQSYISYGNMLRGRERFAEAAEIYSKAIALIPAPGPADWSLFYFRGIAYERTKEWAKAEADFRKALELSPDQPLVLNYLGYSWVDMGMNLEEAMAMIRKAVELRPNDGYIVDSLGWAHYRLGQYDEAVVELERAVSLRPEDPVINDHLGDAYWRQGRVLEAQFQWRHARDFGAKPPELELILKKIAEGRLIDEKEAVAEEEQKDASLYTVQPGDSLWTISAAFLKSGDAFRKILDANRDRLRNPNVIHPGMQLRIPGEI
ncbi:MAG TPA: tetratricopeptide repeat protein [Propylenella sp.]